VFINGLIGDCNGEPASFFESHFGRFSVNWFKLAKKEPLAGNLHVKAITRLCGRQYHPFLVVGDYCHSGIILLQGRLFKPAREEDEVEDKVAEIV
jgi:hypothetical protein